MYGHLKRPDIKPKDPERIAKALELVCGKGLSISFVCHIMKISNPLLSGWMTKYWFYKKINDPVTIVLKSKV
jgi:hypothetical protein